MGAKSDFGPAEPEGRSQTRPVELLAPPYSYLPLVFLLYLLYNRRCRYEDVFFSV